MKRKFKVGDRVRISKKSVFYESLSPTNPSDTNGTVYELRDSPAKYYYKVYWDTGRETVYRDEDLEFSYIRNNPITRTLYPNHTIVDEDWLIPEGGE